MACRYAHTLALSTSLLCIIITWASPFGERRFTSEVSVAIRALQAQSPLCSRAYMKRLRARGYQVLCTNRAIKRDIGMEFAFVDSIYLVFYLVVSCLFHILFGFFQIYNKINDIDIVRSKVSLNLSSDILQIILLATLHLKINLRKP